MKRKYIWTYVTITFYLLVAAVAVADLTGEGSLLKVLGTAAAMTLLMTLVIIYDDPMWKRLLKKLTKKP